MGHIQGKQNKRTSKLRQQMLNVYAMRKVKNQFSLGEFNGLVGTDDGVKWINRLPLEWQGLFTISFFHKTIRVNYDPMKGLLFPYADEVNPLPSRWAQAPTFLYNIVSLAVLFIILLGGVILINLMLLSSSIDYYSFFLFAVLPFLILSVSLVVTLLAWFRRGRWSYLVFRISSLFLVFFVYYPGALGLYLALSIFLSPLFSVGLEFEGVDLSPVLFLTSVIFVVVIPTYHSLVVKKKLSLREAFQ